MPHSIAPKTDVTLYPATDLGAHGAVPISEVGTLPPLMVKLSRGTLSHQIFAVRLPEFSISTELMDDDATFPALEYF